MIGRSQMHEYIAPGSVRARHEIWMLLERRIVTIIDGRVDSSIVMYCIYVFGHLLSLSYRKVVGYFLCR